MADIPSIEVRNAGPTRLEVSVGARSGPQGEPGPPGTTDIEDIDDLSSTLALITSAMPNARTSGDVVLSHSELVSEGLHTWPDGNIGITVVGGVPMLFGANGTKSARVTYDGSGDLVAMDTELEVSGATFDYCAGGPIYHDHVSGKIIMFIHCEDHSLVGDTLYFWSSLAVAYADESDPTDFTFGGTILTPNRGKVASLAMPDFTEMCGGTYVTPGDGYIYVYFKDTLAGTNEWTNMSIARCLLADFLAAAVAGTTPVFNKYHNGGWAAAGIGGLSSNIMPAMGSRVIRWMSACATTDGDVILVASLQEGFPGPISIGYWASKTGPLGFTGPMRTLIAPNTLTERMYVSFLGNGSMGGHNILDLSDGSNIALITEWDKVAVDGNRWLTHRVVSVAMEENLTYDGSVSASQIRNTQLVIEETVSERLIEFQNTLLAQIGPAFARMPVNYAEFHTAGGVHTNSLVETDLFSFIVPPDSAVPGDRFRLEAFGDYLNNSGSSSNMWLKTYVGTLLSAPAATTTFTTSTAKRLWKVELDITVITPTAVLLHGKQETTNPISNGAAGVTVNNMTSQVANALNLGAGTTVRLTAQHSVANAQIQVNCYEAKLVKYPQ